jgi:hypothetical protein
VEPCSTDVLGPRHMSQVFADFCSAPVDRFHLNCIMPVPLGACQPRSLVIPFGQHEKNRSHHQTIQNGRR